MSERAHCIDSLFVDEKSLKPYYADEIQNNNVSIRQLKKIKNNNSNK